VLLAGCAATQPFTTSGGRAAVGVALTAPVYFGSGTTAPANIDVIVENRSMQPLVVRSIRIESSNMAQWGILTISRVFRETVAPGEMKAFAIFATAVTNRVRYTPNEPLNVRAIVQFESEGNTYQELFNGVVRGVE
jgi:hypothetical protein